MDKIFETEKYRISSCTRLSRYPSLTQGLCGFDTVLEQIVSECGEDKALTELDKRGLEILVFPKIGIRDLRS